MEHNAQVIQNIAIFFISYQVVQMNNNFVIEHMDEHKPPAAKITSVNPKPNKLLQ